MQITPSLLGLGHSLASRNAAAGTGTSPGAGAGADADGAGFASLLLQSTGSTGFGAPASGRPAGPPVASMPVVAPHPQAQAPTAQKPASAAPNPAKAAPPGQGGAKTGTHTDGVDRQTEAETAAGAAADGDAPSADEAADANRSPNATDAAKDPRVVLRGRSRQPVGKPDPGDSSDAAGGDGNLTPAGRKSHGEAGTAATLAAPATPADGLPVGATPPAAAPNASDARSAAGDRPGSGDGLADAGSGRAVPSFAEATAARQGRDDRAAAQNAGAATGPTGSADSPGARPPADGGFAALIAGQGTSGPAESRRGAAADSATATIGAGAAAVGAHAALGFGGASAVPAADLPAAVGTPDFARQLGAQVSVFARGGIQQAELHLNPADMGPVSVQITMEGSQARVDFGADVATTRQAIEAGLPALASALADAGFTLAGGGVSQHAAGGGQGSAGGNGQGAGGGQASSGRSGDANGQGGRSAAPEAAAGAARILRRTVSAGGVDTYV